MTKFIWIIFAVLAAIIVYLMMQGMESETYPTKKMDEQKPTKVKIQPHTNKKNEPVSAIDKSIKSSQNDSKDFTKQIQTQNTVVSTKTDAVSNVDAINEYQTTFVPPQKPKYSFEDLENLNISDEEKDKILSEIVAYESYKVRDEPSAVSEEEDLDKLKQIIEKDTNAK